MVHNIDCSGHTGKYAMKEGFSLVEVIIAVALLAFMALPILAYFTNAAVTTSRGKNSQKAVMAAESVLEELNSFDTLEQMEEYLKAESAADPGWSITQAESVTGEAGKTTATTLTRRDIEVDGTAYNAKVTLEYNYPSVSGGYTNPNLQELPELKEVYSSENAVIAEEDQLDRAVSHYLMKYPDQSKVDIINKLNRKLCLDITEKDDIFTVTGSYHYTYNGSEVCLGKFLSKGHRDKVHIATKLPHYYLKRDGDMERYFQEQLERLQTDSAVDSILTLAQMLKTDRNACKFRMTKFCCRLRSLMIS